jgi:hypothetical protein
MARRKVSVAAGVVISSVVLTGCMFNTPERVVKRFVDRLRGMHWGAMAELIDWPQSSQYVPGLPASNVAEEEAKKEVMLRLAENLTGFPVRKRTSDQIRHEFLYLKLAQVKHMKDGDDWAWLDVKITTQSRGKTVQVLVIKIDRVWRIVLTENVFK